MPVSIAEPLARLATLTTDCRTSEQYDLARTKWLEATVDCDMIYQGAVSPRREGAPIVTGVEPSYTATCEANVDRYWPDLNRLNLAARRAGGVTVDLAALSARERRERVFYREVMAGLRIRATAVAVLELRGQPLSCIYFGRTSRQARFGRELEDLRAALSILALGEAVFHPQPASLPLDLGLTPREDEIVGYIVRGLTNAEIAALLGTSPSTVKNQVATILRKTGAANRTELAWRAGKHLDRPAPAANDG